MHYPCYFTLIIQHLENLEKVFQRLREAHLKLKPKKCHFLQCQVSFLGHIVSENGISTDPAMVQKIMDCPPPKDFHEVRSVLEFFSYYRHFIPHYSEIAKPLVKLTEKERPFTWDEEQQKSFEDLKEMLSKASILVHPQPEGDFILDTYASNEGISGVLSQVQDGQEKVIAYGSKMLSKTECNYCITWRDLLAVVHFVTQFKHFLLEHHFLVRTDNSAVRYWTKIHVDSYDPQG